MLREISGGMGGSVHGRSEVDFYVMLLCGERQVRMELLGMQV